MRLSDIECGKITELYRLKMRMPVCKKPMKLTLSVSLSGADTDAQNEWDMYVFPKASASLPKERTLKKHNLAVLYDASANDLASALGNGKRVVLFSAKPFASKEVSWQLSVAGRTHGHLATVIADHPVTKDFPNDGFCSNAFSGMMNCSSAVLDLPSLPHRPIIDVASSYKNAIKEALMFEFGVDNGKLIVCTLNLSESDPGARWLKERILTYAMSDEFIPEQNITLKDLSGLMNEEVTLASVNENAAFNKNDITA